MPETLRPKETFDYQRHIDNSLLYLKVLFNPDYFVSNKQRVHMYLHLDRSYTTFDPNFQIPVGQKDSMRYHGYERGGVNDRAIGSYQLMLFPEEYEESNSKPAQNWTAENMLRKMKLKKEPKLIYGGFNEAFAAGKNVLDIASGQALALLQLSEDFPDTTFIGLDALYEKEQKIFPNKPGTQLTKGNWHVLREIPDNSIDTIISVQGIGMWGLPGSAGGTSIEDGKRIIVALNRVAKKNCVMRIDAQGPALQFLKDNLDPGIWEIAESNDLLIARKHS